MSSAAFVDACAAYRATHPHIACEFQFLPPGFETDHAQANLVHQLGNKAVFVTSDRDAHDYLRETDRSALFLRIIGGLYGAVAILELDSSEAAKCYTDAATAAADKLEHDLEPRLSAARDDHKRAREDVASLLAAAAAAEVQVSWCTCTCAVVFLEALVHCSCMAIVA